MDIYTIQDDVRLRSTPDLDGNNIERLLPKCSAFVDVEKLGDWWKVDGGFVHESMAQELTDTRTPTAPMPFRSQWDADANNRVDDCGQTCVAMLAQWWGKTVAVNALMSQSRANGLSTPTDLVSNFCGVGLAAEAIKLAPGQTPPLPAIVLVRYDGFDRANVQDTKFLGWHWMVLLQKTTRDVVVHDPDFWDARRNEGAAKHYSLQEWERAFVPYSGTETDSVVVVGLVS